MKASSNHVSCFHVGTRAHGLNHRIFYLCDDCLNAVARRSREERTVSTRWEVRCYMIKGKGPSHITTHATSLDAHAYKAKRSSEPKAFGAVFKYKVVRITTCRAARS